MGDFARVYLALAREHPVATFLVTLIPLAIIFAITNALGVTNTDSEPLEDIVGSACALEEDVVFDRISVEKYAERFVEQYSVAEDEGYVQNPDEFRALVDAECPSDAIRDEKRAEERADRAASRDSDQSGSESAGRTVEVPPLRGLNLRVADDRYPNLDLEPVDIAPNVVLERAGEHSRAPILYEHWIIVAQCSLGELVPSGSDLTVGVVKAEEEINGSNMIAGLYDGLLPC